MNIQEHFIVVLIEELAEMQQAASKVLRFSVDHQFEKYDKTNLENLQEELLDVFAVLNILQALIGLKVNTNKEQLTKAIDRKLLMLKKSLELGTITNPTQELERLSESLKNATPN